MKELESELKKDDDLVQKIDFLVAQVRELRKENRELKEKVSRINKAVEEGAITEDEKDELRLKTDMGGPANEEIAKILSRAKTGNGIAVGQVETVLDCSRRHALKMMRKIAKEFDGSFKKGRGNKPSMLRKEQEGF